MSFFEDAVEFQDDAATTVSGSTQIFSVIARRTYGLDSKAFRQLKQISSQVAEANAIALRIYSSVGRAYTHITDLATADDPTDILP